MDTEIETVYTPEELAQQWKVSTETVRALCREDLLGHFMVGRLYRIPESAVTAYRNATLVAT